MADGAEVNEARYREPGIEVRLLFVNRDVFGNMTGDAIGGSYRISDLQLRDNELNLRDYLRVRMQSMVEQALDLYFKQRG